MTTAPKEMDPREQKLRETVQTAEYENQSLFAAIFMTWLAPLIDLGKHYNLSLKDVPAAPTSCLIPATLPLFLQSWTGEFSSLRKKQQKHVEQLEKSSKHLQQDSLNCYSPSLDDIINESNLINNNIDKEFLNKEFQKFSTHPAVEALQPPYDGHPNDIKDTPSPGVIVPIKSFFSPVVTSTLLELLYYVLSLLQPQVIKLLTRYFQQYSYENYEYATITRGIACAFGLGLLTSLATTCQMLKNHLQINWASRTTSSYMAALFDKAVRIAPFALQENTSKLGSSTTQSTTGQSTAAPTPPPAAKKDNGSPSSGSLTNYISTDCVVTYPAALFANMCWAGPVAIFACIFLMYLDLGAAAFIVFFLMMLLFPYQYLTMRLQQYYRRETLRCTDQRLKYTTQLLSGIRVIKLYAWEEPLTRRLNALRQEELYYQRILLLIKNFTMAILMCYPFLVTYLSLIFYVKFNDGQFSPEKVFLILSYLFFKFIFSQNIRNQFFQN